MNEIRFLLLVMSLSICSALALGQEAEPEKAVVKITSQADGKRKTGTGFIVKLEPDIAYIVTAAHVVEGDQAPQVEFFTRQNVTVKAEVRKIEGNDPSGLALMVVRGKQNLAPGLTVLSLGTAVGLKAGDQVSAIGFPSGVASWGVSRINIVSLEGRNIVLSKDLEEGNSGGPILKDNKVVGLVMGLNQGFGIAVPVSIVQTVLTNWGVSFDRAVEATRSEPPVPASGPGNTSGSLNLSANRLDFGEQEVCVKQEKQIQFTNRSAAPLRITRLTLDDAQAFSAQGCIEQTIASGESCSLIVNFLPKSKNNFQTLITVLNSGDPQPQFLTASGTGAAEGWCCWYGYIYPMNKEICGEIRGYFGRTELGFQCKKPRIQPYPIRPDCPPRK